jgi:hypothetical protein
MVVYTIFNRRADVNILMFCAKVMKVCPHKMDTNIAGGIILLPI